MFSCTAFSVLRLTLFNVHLACGHCSVLFYFFSLCIQNEKCIFQTLFTYIWKVYSSSRIHWLKSKLRCFINRTLENSVIELHWTMITYDKIMQKKSIGDERKSNNNRIIAYWTVNTRRAHTHIHTFDLRTIVHCLYPLIMPIVVDLKEKPPLGSAYYQIATATHTEKTTKEINYTLLCQIKTKKKQYANHFECVGMEMYRAKPIGMQSLQRKWNEMCECVVHVLIHSHTPNRQEIALH